MKRQLHIPRTRTGLLRGVGVLFFKWAGACWLKANYQNSYGTMQYKQQQLYATDATAGVQGLLYVTNDVYTQNPADHCVYA